MLWYEFEYNKPYHQMSMLEKLRYEYEPDDSFEEYYNIYQEQSQVEVDKCLN